MMYQKKSGKTAWLRYALVIPVILLLSIIFMSQKVSDTNAADIMSTDRSSLKIVAETDTLRPINEGTQVEEMFMVVEQMPMIMGCETQSCSDEKLMAFLVENLHYPKRAKELKINGRVFVQFVIDPDGLVENVKIVRDIGGGCGAAAMAAIEKMNEKGPMWKAGLQRGKKVRVLYTLPVTFALPANEVPAEEANFEVIPGDKQLITTTDLNGQVFTGEVRNLIGKPLAGVAVSSLGTGTSTQTDGDGKFYMILKSQSEGVRFSYKGYPDYEMKFSPYIQEGQEIFKVVEKMPLFDNCKTRECSNEKLMAFVGENLTYPKSAKDNNKEGKVFAQFVIEKDGRVSLSKILRSIGSGTDEAIEALLLSMNDPKPRWTPGLQRGKPVRVLFTMPVIFALDNNKTITKEATPVMDTLVIFDPQTYTEEYSVQPREIEISSVSPGSLTFVYNTLTDGSFDVIVSNVTGQQMMEETFVKPQGRFEGVLNLPDLNTGVYVLSVVDDGEIVSIKFSYTK